jgi:peptidyl-dipeptidase A
MISLSIFIAIWLANSVNCDDQEKLAVSYLNDIEKEYLKQINAVVVAEWAYDSNLTDENLDTMTKFEIDFANFAKDVGLKLLKFDYKNFKDEDLKRKIKMFTDLGDALLPEEKFKNLSECISQMSANYAKTKVPSLDNSTVELELDPDLTDIIATSREPEKLKYYWTQWYDRVGAANRDLFFEYVKLRNESAHLNSKNFSIIDTVLRIRQKIKLFRFDFWGRFLVANLRRRNF